MEIEIKLGHTVMVDDCIADEIKEINNKYNIQTIDTCCGHGLDSGYIVVSESSTDSMLNLGYVFKGFHNIGYKRRNKEIDIQIYNKYPKFLPKSVCKCHKRIK